MDNRQIRLVSASATIMLVELMCIRWVPAYITLFGFFINFVLLGSLLGIGAGMLSGARPRLPAFPVVLLALVTFVEYFRHDFNVPVGSVLFYGAEMQRASVWGFLLLPTIFLLVALVFVPLGRSLAAAFTVLEPLRAYLLDILGSLSGIAAFALLSWFSTPPAVWIVVVAAASLPLFSRGERLVTLGAFAALVCTLALQPDDYWSPYYRISASVASEDGSRGFLVNGIPHQGALSKERREAFRTVPYDLLGGGVGFGNVLIIGAGTGNDVEVALEHGAKHIDAIEIDPKLYQLGRAMHPDHPYDDPRVNVIINDGRAFLRRTEQKYDLVIYALTDSLVLTSGYANLRLESFLFTVESLEMAKAHLADNGLVVLYNYYREEWSIDRLADMVEDVFAAPPFVVTYGNRARAAVVLTGPRLAALDPSLDHPYGPDSDARVVGSGATLPVVGVGRLHGDQAALRSTDDWPFFYVKERTVPVVYLAGLAMIGVIAFGLLRWLTPQGTLGRFAPGFFFLGAAFMLLEARSLVVFSLLFGTTWIVNAFVFFAILSSVLLAILITQQWRPRSLLPLYLVLFVLLAANYLLPPATLLEIGPSGLRYLVAAGFVFAPVFVANVIFAETFAGTTTAPTAFAWNLIGIMLGGACEYAALVVGYRNLLIPVAIFYAAALLVRWRMQQRAAA